MYVITLPHVAAETDAGKKVIQLLQLRQLDVNDKGDYRAERGMRKEESEPGMAPETSPATKEVQS